MASAVRSLVGPRFTAWLFHFMTLFLVYAQRDVSVYASITPRSEKLDARRFREENFTYGWLLFLSLIFIGVEFVAMIFGFSYRYLAIALVSILAHLIGFVFSLFFVLEEWASTSYLYIFIFCILLPFSLELVMMVKLFVDLGIWQRVQLRL